ncbi:hypothetical protein M1N05_01720 [Dehalococcoidales bacterium]|nr:hypothetical protein [Dehalococcoidales bacterium]
MLTDTSATVRVWYAPDKGAIFYDQILVAQPFIKSGDSGSLVDKGGGFVGLAFAASDVIAVVCKAKIEGYSYSAARHNTTSNRP